MSMRAVVFLVMLIGTAGMMVAPSSADAQTCRFCAPCDEDPNKRDFANDFVSPFLIETTLFGCQNVPDCASGGEPCPGLALNVARELWKMLEAGEDISLVALAEDFRSEVEFVESRGLLVVNDACSGRRAFAFHVDDDERGEIRRILTQRVT